MFQIIFDIIAWYFRFLIAASVWQLQYYNEIILFGSFLGAVLEFKVSKLNGFCGVVIFLVQVKAYFLLTRQAPTLFVVGSWCLSRKVRNRLAHMLTGNIRGFLIALIVFLAISLPLGGLEWIAEGRYGSVSRRVRPKFTAFLLGIYRFFMHSRFASTYGVLFWILSPVIFIIMVAGSYLGLIYVLIREEMILQSRPVVPGPEPILNPRFARSYARVPVPGRPLSRTSERDEGAEEEHLDVPEGDLGLSPLKQGVSLPAFTEFN